MNKDNLLRQFREISASPKISESRGAELRRLLDEVKWKYPEMESTDEVREAKRLFRKLARAGLVRRKQGLVVHGGSPGLGRKK